MVTRHSRSNSCRPRYVLLKPLRVVHSLPGVNPTISTDGCENGPGWGEHAEAGGLWPALHAWPGRTAGTRGARSHRVPRAVRMGTWRIAGRRRLLHAQRLPDHQHPGQPVVSDRKGQAWRLLAAPRAAAAPSAVRHARSGDRVGDPCGPGQAGWPARSGRRVGRVLQQLVHHREEPVLLLQVCPARSARSPLVACRGGAVLSALAAVAGRRFAPAPHVARQDGLADAAGRARGRRLRRRDAAAVPAWHGPDPGV